MPHDARRVGSSVSIPVNVPDDELDAYIAEMILAEAQAKEQSLERRGAASSAYPTPHASRARPATRTNKRFLTSMIRNADAHNQRQEVQEGVRAREPRRRCTLSPERGGAPRAPRASRWDAASPHCRRSKSSRWDVAPSSRQHARTRSPSSELEVGPQPAPPVRLWDMGKPASD